MKGKQFKDNAWFVGFAPYRNPEIVVAAFIENGGYGGTSAAPVAHAVLETYYKKKTGQFDDRPQIASDSAKLYACEVQIDERSNSIEPLKSKRFWQGLRLAFAWRCYSAVHHQSHRDLQFDDELEPRRPTFSGNSHGSWSVSFCSSSSLQSIITSFPNTFRGFTSRASARLLYTLVFGKTVVGLQELDGVGPVTFSAVRIDQDGRRRRVGAIPVGAAQQPVHDVRADRESRH